MKVNNLMHLLAVSLFIVSCSNPNKPHNALASDATILAFGDSLTYGVGANKGEDYPSLLASFTNLKVVNAGVPGEISSKGLNRLPSLLDQHKPDLLILIHGGNDILRKHPRSELKNNLTAMFEEATSRDTAVVALGVPEPGLFLKSADVYQQLANETDVPFQLSLLPEIIGDSDLKADMVHPNAEGYHEMANGVLEFLEDQGFIEN